MNDLQIEYFLAVADNMSFTKTAERLYVTQSAISRQIAVMEKELGVILFDRTNKNIKLTEAGKLFYDFYRNYKTQLRRTIEEANYLNQTRTGHVSIGYLENWNLSNRLLQVFNAFSKSYPNVQLSIECMSVKDMVSALKNDKVDIAITIDDTIHRLPGIKSEPFLHLSRVLFVSKNHPLASKEDLCVEDLRNETFLTFEGQAENAKEMLYQLYGIVPRMQIINKVESVYTCARSGLGIAIGNAWTFAVESPDFISIPLPAEHQIVLAMKEDLDNQAADVLANEVMLMMRGEE